MKFNRLVAFGCSLTYGHGLPDCFSKDNKSDPGPRPSVYAWPQILADLLDLDCVNLSDYGSSNKKICYEILNSQIDNRDLVFVNWSHVFRYCIIKADRIVNLGPWSSDKEGKSYLKLMDSNDLLIDSNLRLRLAHLYLENLQIKHFMLNSDKLNFTIDSDLANIVLGPSIYDYRDCLPKAADNQHPGEQAHRRFAEEVFHEVKNCI